jgi:hypothetical protein
VSALRKNGSEEQINCISDDVADKDIKLQVQPSLKLKVSLSHFIATSIASK